MKLLLLSTLAACGAGAPSAAAQLDMAQWTADDGTCVTSSTSRSQADACRDAIRKLFCSPDSGLLAGPSGACTAVRLSDGGAP